MIQTNANGMCAHAQCVCSVMCHERKGSMWSILCDWFWEPFWCCLVGPDLEKEAKIGEAGHYWPCPTCLGLIGFPGWLLWGLCVWVLLSYVVWPLAVGRLTLILYRLLQIRSWLCCLLNDVETGRAGSRSDLLCANSHRPPWPWAVPFHSNSHTSDLQWIYTYSLIATRT